MAPYKLSAAEYKYLIAHCRFGVLHAHMQQLQHIQVEFLV